MFNINTLFFFLICQAEIGCVLYAVKYGNSNQYI